MDIALHFDLTAVVILANGTKVDAFTLNTTVQSAGILWIGSSGTKQIVAANATFINVNFELEHSAVGTFAVSFLAEAITLFSRDFLLPRLNKYGNAGIEIPTIDGVSFVQVSQCSLSCSWSR